MIFHFHTYHNLVTGYKENIQFYFRILRQKYTHSKRQTAVKPLMNGGNPKYVFQVNDNKKKKKSKQALNHRKKMPYVISCSIKCNPDPVNVDIIFMNYIDTKSIYMYTLYGESACNI